MFFNLQGQDKIRVAEVKSAEKNCALFVRPGTNLAGLLLSTNLQGGA